MKRPSNFPNLPALFLSVWQGRGGDQNTTMNESDYNTLAAMEKFGGNFVQKLAAAYIAADDDNRTIIRSAFAAIWARYRKMGETANQL